MYVCSCRAVTDHEIRAEIDRGARDENEIGRLCGAGTDCGTCLDEIRRLCEEVHDDLRRGVLIRS